MMEPFHPDEIADMQAEMRLARPEAQRPLEAATLTVLRGGVPVSGWENVPGVYDTSSDVLGERALEIEAVFTYRSAAVPSSAPELSSTMTFHITFPGGQVEHRLFRQHPGDVLRTTQRLEFERPKGVTL